jgi:tRNA-Thr(GGU) m(6)t(6)A37 methyltransferase TsaA
MAEIRYRPIGVIHSPFKEPKDVPKRIEDITGKEGSVEVATEYAEGLKDLENLSHIILIFHFHLSGSPSLIMKPLWDASPHGVFMTRSPARPNPIGMSIVRLKNREGNVLHVQDIDIVDGTPLLDIKPYVPDLDRKETTKASGTDQTYR